MQAVHVRPRPQPHGQDRRRRPQLHRDRGDVGRAARRVGRRRGARGRRQPASRSAPARTCTSCPACCARTGSPCRTSATSTGRRSRARPRPARTAPACGSAASRRVSAGRRSSRRAASLRPSQSTSSARSRVGLGALGVLVEVTIECVPEFVLHAARAPAAVRHRRRRMDAAHPVRRPLRVLRLAAHRHRAHEDEHAPARRTRRASPWARSADWVDDRMSNQLFEAMLKLGRVRPRTIPAHQPAVGQGHRRPRVLGLVAGGVHEPAHGALPRDGVRAAGRGGARRPARPAPAHRRPAVDASRSRSRCARPPPTTSGSRPRPGATTGYIAVHRY